MLFLGTHAFSMARTRRAAIVGRIGEGRYKLGYIALSLLGLVLIVGGVLTVELGSERAQRDEEAA